MPPLFYSFLSMAEYEIYARSSLFEVSMFNTIELHASIDSCFQCKRNQCYSNKLLLTLYSRLLFGLEASTSPWHLSLECQWSRNGAGSSISTLPWESPWPRLHLWESLPRNNPREGQKSPPSSEPLPQTI